MECPRCNRNKSGKGGKLCQKCKDYKKKIYEDKKKRGECGLCERKPRKGFKICDSCREKSKIRQDKLRIEVLYHYGKKCKNCGITDVRVLDLEHIKNNGNVERKKFGKGNGFFLSVKRRKYPKGLQVMCKNCNWLKRLSCI